MLEKKNKHERDDNIVFEEYGHKYTYNGDCNMGDKDDMGDKKDFKSVTTVVHEFFEKFDADKIIDKMMESSKWPNSKYYGMTKEEIKQLWSENGKNASKLGTQMHAEIEDYFNERLDVKEKTKEYKQFEEFWKEFKNVNPTWEPFRTEWIVYDEKKKLAGSIDFLLSDSDGNIVIIDWKRSKEIKMANKFKKGTGPFKSLDDCNYNHYTIQLNCYRHIIETKYNKKVAAMYIVVCHPNNDCAQIITINRREDIIEDLWKHLPL